MTAPVAVDVRRNLAYHIAGMKSAAASCGFSLSPTFAAEIASDLERIDSAVARLIDATSDYLAYDPIFDVSKERNMREALNLVRGQK